MKIKDSTLLKWFVVILTISFSSIFKVVGFTNQSIQYAFCISFSVLSMIYMYFKYNRNRIYYQSLKYTFHISTVVILMTVVELIYTIIMYSNYNLKDWRNSLMYVILFTCMSSVIVYLIQIRVLPLRKLIDIIIICTLISYLIRFFIQFYYSKTGTVLFEDIAYECAAAGWIRNNKLRINPPSFGIIIVPLTFFMFKTSGKTIKKVFYLIVLALALYFTYNVHMARSMFLYQIVTVAMMFFIQKKRNITQLIMSTLIIMLVAIAGATGLFDFIIGMIESLMNGSGTVYGDTLTVRTYALKYYAEWYSHNPILGIGALTNDQLVRNLILGHISDIGFIGTIFRFGVFGMLLYTMLFGRWIYISAKLMLSSASNRANLTPLAVGITVSNIITSINIDCFYFIFVYSVPFSIAIMEYIYHESKIYANKKK